jgi:type I restriction enzyme S subunit
MPLLIRSNELLFDSLPSDWKLVKLQKVCEFSKKPRSITITDDQLLPFIPMDAISDKGDSIRYHETKKYSEISSGSFVFKNDLIVAKITPSFENGKQAILRELPTEFAYATTEIWPIHPKANNIIIQFLGDFLRISSIRSHLTGKMEGSTNRQRLPREALNNLNIPLPPLPEQRAIAHVLRTVQEAREKTEAVIAATKALKKAMMKHLFIYGPVPPEAAEKVPLKETDIGMVPEGWEVVEFQNLLERNTQNGFYKSREFYGNGIPIVDMKDIFASDILSTSQLERVQLSEKELEKYCLSEGDLLFARRSFKPSGSGKCQLVENISENVIFASSIIRVSPKKDIVNSKCYFYLFLSPFGKNLMKKIIRELAVSGISGGDLRELKIPKIPLREQGEIVTLLSSIDKKIAAEESRRQALDTLFKTLLHDLMTAKIRVNVPPTDKAN